ARDELDEERGDILRQPMIVGRIVGEQHLAHPGDGRRGLGDRAAVLSGHQNVDVFAGDLPRGGYGVEGRRLERVVVVLGDDESGHQITRASVLSLSTSSATEPTLRPPSRFGGSSTLSTVRRGVASTPSVSGVVVTLGVLFARLLLGRD